MFLPFRFLFAFGTEAGCGAVLHRPFVIEEGSVQHAGQPQSPGPSTHLPVVFRQRGVLRLTQVLSEERGEGNSVPLPLRRLREMKY